MCPSRSSFVHARVVQRLLDAGVDRDRAEAVGRKVARAYESHRQHAAARWYATAHGAKLAHAEDVGVPDEQGSG